MNINEIKPHTPIATVFLNDLEGEPTGNAKCPLDCDGIVEIPSGYALQGYDYAGECNKCLAGFGVNSGDARLYYVKRPFTMRTERQQRGLDA